MEVHLRRSLYMRNGFCRGTFHFSIDFLAENVPLRRWSLRNLSENAQKNDSRSAAQGASSKKMCICVEKVYILVFRPKRARKLTRKRETSIIQNLDQFCSEFFAHISWGAPWHPGIKKDQRRNLLLARHGAQKDVSPSETASPSQANISPDIPDPGLLFRNRTSSMPPLPTPYLMRHTVGKITRLL